MRKIFGQPKQKGTFDPTEESQAGDISVLELEKGRRGAMIRSSAEDLAAEKIITASGEEVGDLEREFIEFGAGKMVGLVKVKPGLEGFDDEAFDVGLFKDRSNSATWAALIERSGPDQLNVTAVARAMPGESIVIGRDDGRSNEAGVSKLNLPVTHAAGGGSQISRNHINIGIPEAEEIAFTVEDFSANGGVSVASTNAVYTMME